MTDKGKGKGKAKAISGPVIVSSDEEDNARFFESQRPVRVRNLPASTARAISPEYSESESDGGTTSRRRKKKKAVTKPSLPEWTRQGLNKRVDSRKGKERAISGETDVVINLVSSEEEGEGATRNKRSKDKGKGRSREKEIKRADRLSLTPPPLLSDAKLKEIENVVKNYLIANDLQSTTLNNARDGSSSPSRSDNNTQDIITIIVNMHADPERINSGASANAIKQYEKPRSVIIRRDAPLSEVYSIVGDRIGKEPEQIIMTRNGVKIYSTVVTPRQLHLEDRVQFEGYERHVWDAINSIRESPPPSSQQVPLSTDDAHPPENLNGSGTAKSRIRLNLRGAWGECKLGVSSETTSKGLLEYYAKKFDKGGGGIYLVFDGERVRGDVSVEEMGIEDQDVVDVEGC